MQGLGSPLRKNIHGDYLAKTGPSTRRKSSAAVRGTEITPEVSLSLHVGGWLKDIRISQISEWDILMFLYRHGMSLADAAQIALLVGYGTSAVGKALARLASLGLVKRSPSFQGVRLFRFAMPLDSTQKESMRQLLKLSEKRSGRLMVLRSLTGHTAFSAQMGAGLVVKKEG
jgi:hypothetical protein